MHAKLSPERSVTILRGPNAGVSASYSNYDAELDIYLIMVPYNKQRKLKASYTVTYEPKDDVPVWIKRDNLEYTDAI